MNVLIVDDNTQLSTTIREFLELKNFETLIVNDGQEAIKKIEEYEFDLFIVDIHLPNINGLDIVKFIRGKDLNVPIIMITSSNEIENFKTAFNNGANEFIRKPFHLEELEIRINNLLNKPLKETIKIDKDISFDIFNQNLYINNKLANLRTKEKRFLTILVKNINNPISSKKIIDFVWENEFKEDYPLRQLVSSLKNRFPILKKYVHTIHKVGYILKKEE